MSDTSRLWDCSGFCFKEADRCVEIALLENSHPIYKRTFRQLATQWLGTAHTCRGKFRWFSWCQPEISEIDEPASRPWSPFVAQFIGSFLKSDVEPKEVTNAYMADRGMTGK